MSRANQRQRPRAPKSLTIQEPSHPDALIPEPDQFRAFRQRFEVAAQALSRLRHPRQAKASKHQERSPDREHEGRP